MSLWLSLALTMSHYLDYFSLVGFDHCLLANSTGIELCLFSLKLVAGSWREWERGRDGKGSSYFISLSHRTRSVVFSCSPRRTRRTAGNLWQTMMQTLIEAPGFGCCNSLCLISPREKKHFLHWIIEIKEMPFLFPCLDDVRNPLF